MLTHVLHAQWSVGKVHLWAEAARSAVPAGASVTAGPSTLPHPQACDAAELQSVIEHLMPGLTGLKGATLKVLLPAHEGVPLPSPAIAHAIGHAFAEEAAAHLALHPWDVATLTIEPAQALKVLDRLDAATTADAPTHVEPGQIGKVGRGDDLRFFIAAARFARYLLAQQRFVPALVQDMKGSLKGLWQPWLSDEFISQRAAALLEAMPPSARCVVDSLQHEAWPILEDFLARVSSAQCRQILRDDTMEDAIEGREPSDPHVAWLTGLLREDDSVSAVPEQRPELLKRVRHWIGSLEQRGASSVWRLCLTLTEPVDLSGLQDLQTPGPGLTWPLTLGLQSVSSPDVVVDAQDLWLLPSDGAVIGGQRVERPQELILAELGRAARIYKPLERALDQAEPTGIKLATNAAYEFLREHRAILSEAGFGVITPLWWDSPQARLGVRMQLEGAGDGPGSPSGGSPGAVAPKIGLHSLVNYRWEISLGSTTLTLQEFEKLASMRSPLVMIGGRWVEVRPEDVQAAVKFIRENPGGQMELGRAMRLAYAADMRQTGLPVVGMDVSGWLSQIFGGDGKTSMPMLEPPQGFIGSLRAYQLKGLSWMAFMDRFGLGACLADDMGLGKTIQLLAMMLHERMLVASASSEPPAEAGGQPSTTSDASPTASAAGSDGIASGIGPTLLIVPLSVVGNWVREARRFAPSLRVMVHHGTDRAGGESLAQQAMSHDLVLTTYALAHRDRESLELISWHRVALDEAQNVKNPMAKQTQAIRALEAPRRLALTGTPIENRLSELWSIMDFLNPGLLGPLGDFRSRFALPIERYHDGARAKKLKALVQPFVLRRLKTDPSVIADLPEKVETKEYCYLTPEQASLYETTVKQMLSAAEAADGIQRRGLILAGLVKLKQICNHPHQFLRDADDHQGASPAPARSGKCVRLVQMLEEVVAAGGQALVFTQFRQMGGILAGMLRQELDREVLFLHGGTTMKERDALIQSFQKADGKSPIFVLSLKAGGVGLNLTAANHVFHFDRWWNPAVENQATDRAFRIGQTRTVQVHKFVVAGTLEERIDQMIEQKTELADNVIGSGEAWLTELSLNQLRDVLMLRPDAVAGADEQEGE